jgi:hypothetical protein
MNRHVFSYVKKLYGNFYLALYALLLLIYPSIFCYIHVPALPCAAAPASVCASHSLTGALEVSADSQGGCEFCFGNQLVLLDGQPMARPMLGRAQSSHPAQLGSQP